MYPSLLLCDEGIHGGKESHDDYGNTFPFRHTTTINAHYYRITLSSVAYKTFRVYSSEYRNIISCEKFWQGAKTLAHNFGKEKHAKTFGMEFRAEILCRNSEPKY